jgi:hypothetical protein
MKYLKRFAILALPVIAVMSMSIPANAAQNAEMRTVVLGSDGTVSASAAYYCPPDPPWAGYISNETGIGTGVINICNGNELYDAILPAHRRTDTYFGWGTAQGFYVGPGGCVQSWHWNGSEWRYVWTHSNNERVTLGDDRNQSFDRWALRNC